MSNCFSLAATWNRFHRFTFSKAGLKSTTTDLGDGTVMHCWAPKAHKQSKPNLLLIHGIGANAMWQWKDVISPLISHFNVYVPDLVFFGDSYTTRPDRTESFQARCVMGLMEAQGVKSMRVVGVSYGGFVAYSMATQFKESVERVVLCCAGICMEEKDMDEGMFKTKSVDEAISILLPQSPEKMKELMQLTFVKPSFNVKTVPTCILNDFINVLCTEYYQEKKELIHALHKDRKLSDLPKITQPTLIIWGEQDQVFPLELAHRLKRHVGENAELVILKNAGHAINIEKTKEMYKHMKSFLMDAPPPPEKLNHSNGHKVD
uniref:AB hydrolase-1 domain-containing protein n=1 Tax=Fagus sylvatica TaxID=28930 RepID=A0A2N9IXD6_FAGSY